MLAYIKKPSEWLMITAGILILISVPLVVAYDLFTLWFIAKALYLLGVIAMFIES